MIDHPRARAASTTYAETMSCSCRLQFEVTDAVPRVRSIWPCLEHSVVGVWRMGAGGTFTELARWEEEHTAGPEVPA